MKITKKNQIHNQLLLQVQDAIIDSIGTTIGVDAWDSISNMYKSQFLDYDFLDILLDNQCDYTETNQDKK